MKKTIKSICKICCEPNGKHLFGCPATAPTTNVDDPTYIDELERKRQQELLNMTTESLLVN